MPSNQENYQPTQAPSVLSTLWVIISLELERTFLSRQGLLYLLAFSFFWMMLLKYAVFNDTLLMMNSAVDGDSYVQKIFTNYFKISLYLFPILSLFMAANQTGSDRERGTLRFISLHASRDAIFFARFLSQIMIHYVFILFSLISTLIMGFYQQVFVTTNAVELLMQSVAVAGNLALIILPFIALMALLSAVLKSPRQVTFYAGVIWSLAMLVINLISHYLPAAQALNILVPGMQFSQLSALSGMALYSLAYIPLMQCGLLLLAGRVIMRRQAL